MNVCVFNSEWHILIVGGEVSTA